VKPMPWVFDADRSERADGESDDDDEAGESDPEPSDAEDASAPTLEVSGYGP
jgi:hypothetical protein